MKYNSVDININEKNKKLEQIVIGNRLNIMMYLNM